MIDDQDDKAQDTPKLFRSKENRLIGGVCGGVAEYFKIDPFIVRIGWIFITLFAGAGIIAYIAALIIVPENPNQEYSAKKVKKSGDSAKLWGTLLIVFGGLLLLKQTGVLYYFHFWSFPWQAFMAVLLIGFGIYIMYNKKSDEPETSEFSEGDEALGKEKSPGTNFYRINENKMIAGVCSGLAHYFDIDVTLIRLLWVFAALASGGLAIIAYIIAVIVFPDMSPQIKNGGEQ
jgi:phage shock protein C